MSLDINTLSSLGLTEPAVPVQGKKDEMGQDMFLKLMLTQLNNQNPLKPQDSSEFLSQLAQFSMVSGIQGLQKDFSTFATSSNESQALQAANLVGKNVLVSSDLGVLSATGDIRGEFEVPESAAAVQVKIVGANGVSLRTLDLGPRAQGVSSFEWDGMLDDGLHHADPGTYTIKVEASMGGKLVALEPKVQTPVESVTLGGSKGIEIDLGILGRRSLKEIDEIM